MRCPNIAALAAFLGVWVCFCAIGEFVLDIQSFGWVMVWGVIAFIVATRVEHWIKKPSPRKGGVRGR